MKNLGDFRKEIDRIDLEICKLIAIRFKITRQVGLYKIKNNLQLEDKKREKEIMEKFAKKATTLNIDPTLIQKIFRLIIDKTKENYKKYGV
jgi:chorismate mutase